MMVTEWNDTLSVIIADGEKKIEVHVLSPQAGAKMYDQVKMRHFKYRGANLRGELLSGRVVCVTNELKRLFKFFTKEDIDACKHLEMDSWQK
jgi:hypothetical protein